MQRQHSQGVESYAYQVPNEPPTKKHKPVSVTLLHQPRTPNLKCDYSIRISVKKRGRNGDYSRIV